jgi:hypothetical protein
MDLIMHGWRNGYADNYSDSPMRTGLEPHLLSETVDEQSGKV